MRKLASLAARSVGSSLLSDSTTLAGRSQPARPFERWLRNCCLALAWLDFQEPVPACLLACSAPRAQIGQVLDLLPIADQSARAERRKIEAKNVPAGPRKSTTDSRQPTAAKRAVQCKSIIGLVNCAQPAGFGFLSSVVMIQLDAESRELRSESRKKRIHLLQPGNNDDDGETGAFGRLII